MSEKESGGIRRVTRKDRKRKLETGDLIFPPEEPEAEAAAPDVPETAAAPEPEAAVEKPVEEPAEAAAETAIFEPPVETETLPPAAQVGRFPPLAFEPERAPEPGSRPQPARAGSPPRRGNTLLPNLISLLFMLATLVAIGWFALVWSNPYTPLNPFPPYTPLPVIITTTPLPPTPTLSPTPAPPTPSPTFTPLPVEALATSAPFPFALVDAGVVYAPNGNGQGCAWASLAGSVTDAGGGPLDGYQVRVSGDGLEQAVFTGAALTYGPGGFELPLGEAPRAAEYTVQLFDPDGAPVSDVYRIVTRADCDGSVAIISFVQSQ